MTTKSQKIMKELKMTVKNLANNSEVELKGTCKWMAKSMFEKFHQYVDVATTLDLSISIHIYHDSEEVASIIIKDGCIRQDSSLAANWDGIGFE